MTHKIRTNQFVILSAAKNPKKFFLLTSCIPILVSCFLLLTSCQPKTTVATAHNKKLLDVIARSEATKQSNEDKEEIMRLTPVHFTTGTDTILNEEKSALDSNIAWLEDNPKAVLVIEGHCDERGADYYNMELGDRRARSIKTHLIKKGIVADRLIMVVSYGERAPADPRHTKDAWHVNRRVEFIIR